MGALQEKRFVKMPSIMTKYISNFAIIKIESKMSLVSGKKSQKFFENIEV